MSTTLINVLEKFKKVEKGPLDPQRSGADGAEDDFIGKHIDNVEDHDDSVNKDGHPHTAGEKGKRAPIKKHRKGYEKGEDETVYEEVDLIDEELEILANIVEEAIDEFMEEATDEEREIIAEMLETDEGYNELIAAVLEAKDDCECDDDEDDEDNVKINPKLKNAQKKEMGGIKEDIERRADQKIVKAKTPDGKVVFRKQRAETAVSKNSD